MEGLWTSRHQKYLGFARLVRELRRRTGDGEDEDGVLVNKTGADEDWAAGGGGDSSAGTVGGRLPLRAFAALHSSTLGMSTGAIGSPRSTCRLILAWEERVWPSPNFIARQHGHLPGRQARAIYVKAY